MQRASRLLPFVGLALLLFVAGCGSESSSDLLDPEAVRAEVDEMIWARETRKRLLTQNAAPAEGVSVLVEVVEAPISQVSQFLSKNPTDGTDSDFLRREVQIWLKTDQATLEDFAVIHGNFGSRSQLQAIAKMPGIRLDGNAQPSESKERWSGRILTILPRAGDRNEIELELSTEMRKSTDDKSPVSQSIQTTVKNGSYALLEVPAELDSTEASDSDEVVRLTFVRADSF